MRDTRKRSNKLKLLSGNPGKRKLKPEPKFKNDKIIPPDWLSEIGLAEWHRNVPGLIASGVLTNLDTAIMAAYCDQYSVWRQASQDIRERGVLIKKTPRSKFLTQNPCLPIQWQALKLMKSLAKELGITPVSRSRVSVNPVPEDDPYEQLKRRRVASLKKAKRKAKIIQDDNPPLPTG